MQRNENDSGVQDRVTVDVNSGETYAEDVSGLRKIKLRLQYKFHLRWIKWKIKKLKSQGREESDIKVLELGSGPGFFAEALMLALPSVQYTGLEFDPRCIQSSREKVSANYTFLQGNVEQFDLANKYDFIVSFQVIEHLYEPQKMLECIDEHLQPHGILIVTTPNLGGLSARLMKDKWSGFRHDHVSLKGCNDWESFIARDLYSTLFSGSTFFSGLPWVVNTPLSVINNLLLVSFGALRWQFGESYVGVFARHGQK